jgi:hypothetical protein
MFKLLSECLASPTDRSLKQQFQYHLFLQVGEYATLKDEYLCLVPTSDFLGIGGLSAREILGPADFIYVKNYVQNPRIMTILTDIESNLPQL